MYSTGDSPKGQGDEEENKGRRSLKELVDERGTKDR
jgi:hypothetical protein